MTEEWKPIDGFTGYYVSNLGRIKSYKRDKENGRIIQPRLSKKGYYFAFIYDDNNKRKCVQVHRAVLKTFNPVENMNKLEVNHKDEVKTNNCLSNLEWTTHAENVRYGTGSKRAVEPQKMKIKCVENGVIYNSMREASETLGIGYGNISRCCSGRLKTTNGFSFEVIDYGSRPHPKLIE